jgi:hypothetical protein
MNLFVIILQKTHHFDLQKNQLSKIYIWEKKYIYFHSTTKGNNFAENKSHSKQSKN